MGALTIATTGTYNWVCPPGVTTVQVELWGAGGTGGPSTGTASGAGGGAGGQYAIKQVTVIPGNTYAVVVPAASTAATSAVVNGADATFAATTVVAKGGPGGAAATGATSAGGAGSTTGGVGDTVFAGGNGATGVSSTSSGGGGSGAGSTGTGNNGAAGTGGAAKASNGGAGGNGVTTANTRNAGGNYGGGGSGALSSSATDRAGGNGGQGLAILTFTLPKTETLTDNFSSTDTAKWTYAGSATTSLGQLNIPCNTTTNTDNGTTDNITSADVYDFTDSYVSLQTITLPTSSSGALASLRIQSQPASTSWMDICTFNGGLYCRERVAGTKNEASIVAWSSAVAWWRLMTVGTTMYWHTSSDGINWTQQRTKTAGVWDFTQVRIRVLCGYDVGSSGQLGTLVADNLNLGAAPLASLAPPVRRPNYGGLLQL